MLIVTLIAADRLTDSHVSLAVARLAAGGMRVDRVEWLERGSACTILVEEPGIKVPPDFLDGRISDVDLAAVPAWHPRRKRLLVADMDSTMISVECIDELADFAGIKPQVAAITERAMQGELDFAAALEARVALLAGMEAATIDRCREERVRPTPGAATLVRTMKARGATCLLVSGGFTHFAEPVADLIGFDRAYANALIVEDGKLTGAVRRPIVGAEAKRDVLRAAAAELGIDLLESVAIGDGANDLPMLAAAGLAVGYRAKPAVAAAVRLNIRQNDLTALLYAQGISRQEWVAA